MGYRLVTAELLGLIRSQKILGESNRAIARNLGLDRGTVNRYLEAIARLGIPAAATFQEALQFLAPLAGEKRKMRPGRSALKPYEDEIRDLLAGDRKAGRLPMKAKTAWLVVSERHGLLAATSYESFKRFVRDRTLLGPRVGATVRIEVEPGAEAQVDYAKMGTREIGTRRRTVYAFIGILSHSRQPFVSFTTSQDQVSFSRSLVAMLEFYGGSPIRINLDNLKSGVLEADIYDPVLNRTFAELCDHYGIVADPARPASPKDKGKVERLVQVVRELWKRLDATHPSATLDELNELALIWCREEYGRSIHGTTGRAPYVAFETVERPRLKALPGEPFVPASWTVAKVQSDQFITVHKRRYGLPATLIGKELAVRSTASVVEIYHEHKLIRTYPAGHKTVSYLPDDFPLHGRPFEPGAFAAALVFKAGAFGPQAGRYVRLMLEGGGNLGLRRAQACLALLESHRDDPAFSHVLGEAIARNVFRPSALAVLFEAGRLQNVIEFPLSPRGASMGRPAGYYSGT